MVSPDLFPSTIYILLALQLADDLATGAIHTGRKSWCNRYAINLTDGHRIVTVIASTPASFRRDTERTQILEPDEQNRRIDPETNLG